MRLGAIDLNALLAQANPCVPPIGNPQWDAWAAAHQKLLADADAFTAGGTRYTRTRKYYFMRAEIAKSWAREPISRCMLDHQKRGRNISDYQALNEIRAPRLRLAKEWTARATKEERNKQIQVAATVAAIATAGAAALAAAGSAGGVTTAAGMQAAAGSIVGAAPGATVKQIATHALKKFAIEKGVEKAVEFAAEEYAKRLQKKMSEAEKKALAKELAAAEAEYAALIAQGKSPQSAVKVASGSGGGGAIFPLGLAVLAFKLLS